MPGIAALTLLLCIYAFGEIVACKTKAVLSTVLVLSFVLFVGFVCKWIPTTIFEDSGVTTFGNIFAGIMITSLGTTLDFVELKRQWRVVLIALIEVVGASLFIVIGGMIFSMKDVAIAGAPVFAGGSAATLIMISALKAKGLEALITCCLVIYVLQKFIGIPIASFLLKREAMHISRKDSQRTAVEVREHRKMIHFPTWMDKPSVHLALLALVTLLSYYLSLLMNGVVHYFVICLLAGVLFFSIGILDHQALKKSHSEALVTFLVTIIIFTNLSTITFQQIIDVLLPLMMISLFGVIGIFVTAFICQYVFPFRYGLLVSIGISCTFGFPTTMLLPKEVAEAVGTDKEHVQQIEDYLMPIMLVAGFVSVTIVSVLIAGIAVEFL